MKVIFYLFLFTFSLNVFGGDLPKKVYVKADILNMDGGTDFDIKSDKGDVIGRVVERVFRTTTTFEYFNTKGEKVAYAKKSLFSWGVEMKVYDGKTDRLIGSIHENVMESMFSVSSIYSVYDANNNKIATSEKLSFFGTDIDIYIKSKINTEISRDAINLFSDTWTIEFKDEAIDRRLLIFIPCYKTVSDKEK